MLETLKLSDNSKVKFKKNHFNTFGLNYGLPENGGTCPGATTGKGGCLDTRDGLKRQTCYMVKIVQIYKAVGEVLSHNTLLLQDKTEDEMYLVLKNTMDEFVRKSKNVDLFFRLHTSGDFFSLDYCKAWARVIQKFQNVIFWAYTRSHDLIEPLLGLKNLTLFLSVDPSNFDKGLKVFQTNREQHNNLGLAWMGPNPPKLEGSDRFISCPETSKKLMNMPDKGACSKCKICVDNYRIRVKNVCFNIH